MALAVVATDIIFAKTHHFHMVTHYTTFAYLQEMDAQTKVTEFQIDVQFKITRYSWYRKLCQKRKIIAFDNDNNIINIG